jgi:hypothetical protein
MEVHVKLEISAIMDAGVLDSERIVLQVNETVDIGFYALIRSKKGTAGGPVSGSKDAYWFPDRKLEPGDKVVLYTKAGRAVKRVQNEKHTATHFFYWHKTKALWGSDSTNVAVIAVFEEWLSVDPATHVL